MEYVTLQNGVAMPMLGYGTIGQTGEQITDNVAFALTHGYELIDTANRYGNEVEVGRGLRKSGLKRENYFLETKLSPTLYENETAIDGALQRLGVDYIDLMILHHPVNNYLHAYGMLERACKAGKLRAIGLSNFPVEKLQEVLGNCEIPPMVMQVEAHPSYPAEGVRSFCEEHRIQLQCWYPLGHGDKALLEEPLFAELAKKYGKTNAQVILRWHIQAGNIVIPGSKNPAHIKDNFDLFDFSLTEEEMAKITALDKDTRYYTSTPEMLRRYAEMVPDVDGQK